MIKAAIPESDSSFTFELKSLIEKAYSIEIYYSKGPDHGNWGIYVGETKFGEINGYAAITSPGEKVILHDISNPDWRLKIRFVREGKDEKSSGYRSGLEGYNLIPVRTYIPEWYFTGPFANPRGPRNEGLGLDSVYPPEESVDLKEKYSCVTGQPVGWKYVKTPEYGYLSLSKWFKSTEPVVGYAVTYIFSTENTKCVLYTGSDDGMKVFFNNRMMYKFSGKRMAEPDQAMIILEIKRGWNKLLLKIENNHDGSGFYARLLDFDYQLIISAGQKKPPLNAKQ